MKEITRHQSRQLALQLLYQQDYNPKTMKALLNQLKERHPSLDASSFVWQLITGVLAESTSLDEMISMRAENWKLNRISAVDRNILRLALYELTMMEEIPDKVAINEAVELAKEFSGERAASFINGILGAVLRQGSDGEDE